MAKVEVERYGPVTVLKLNRPEAHNCVDGETAAAIAETILSFASDAQASVLVVTGNGDKAFCSGADLKNPSGLMEHEYFEQAGPMGFARLNPGKPTIAAVNGYCFAGGLELAAWCDFRIASENAEFGALNRRWGVPFTDGGTQRFARIAGVGNALYLIQTGMRIDAAKALGMGLVQEVVPVGAALDRALQIAERLAEYPQISLQADRRATLEGLGMPLEHALKLEAEICLPAVWEPEMAAGLEKFVTGNRPEAPRP